MPQDELQNIPSFAANRDEAVSSAPPGASPSRSRVAGPATAGSVLGRLVLVVAFVVAAVAVVWAWQLQVLLDGANRVVANTEQRVADLEALLSDTDETVNQSAQTLGAQMRLLDTEVRKLWDARRISNNRIDKLEEARTDLDRRATAVTSRVNQMQPQLAAISTDLAALKTLAADLERLTQTASQAATEVERIADAVNRSNLQQSALAKRVNDNEEWIESINAFRRQVNASIQRLEVQMREQAANTASAAAEVSPAIPATTPAGP